METAIPQEKMTLSSTINDLKKEVKNIEEQVTEDEKIAQLHKQVGWEALKDRINRKIEMVENSTKIDSNSIALIDNIELYGFKCMAKDLLIEAYKGIIDDVELTAKVLNDKKNEEKNKREN